MVYSFACKCFTVNEHLSRICDILEFFPVLPPWPADGRGTPEWGHWRGWRFQRCPVRRCSRHLGGRYPTHHDHQGPTTADHTSGPDTQRDSVRHHFLNFVKHVCSTTQTIKLLSQRKQKQIWSNITVPPLSWRCSSWVILIVIITIKFYQILTITNRLHYIISES